MVIFLTILYIVLYVASAAFMFNTVLLYSINNKLYWLSFIIFLIFLIGGIVASYFVTKIKYKDLTKVREFKEKPEKDERNVKFIKRRSTLFLFIALGGILVSAFSAMVVDTSGFSVSVFDFNLTKEMTVQYNTEPLNGKSYVIDNNYLKYAVTEYKPKSASEDNKTPVLFVLPGFTRTKETQNQYCLEMSRRGYTCFSIDPGCQGGSTYAGVRHDPATGEVVLDENGNPVYWSSSTGANGMNYLVQYVYNNKERFNYVDRDKFGIFGHSQGSLNVLMVAQNFAGSSYSESVIKALQFSGYYAGISGRFASLHTNACLSYGLYEEGYYNGTYETVALKFLNDVNGTCTNHYTDIEIDKPYGDVNDGSFRILRREKINHCLTMFSREAIRNSINFFNTALQVDGVLDGTHQVWQVKEAFTGLAMVFGFMLIVALAKLLVNFKFFNSIKGEPVKTVKVMEVEDKKYVQPTKLADRIIFWITTAFTAILACLDYMPLTRLANSWLVEAANAQYTYTFPAEMLNGVMFWAVVNGLVGLALFFLTILGKYLYRKYVSKNYDPELDKEKFKSLKIGIIPLLKTLLLAVILFLVFYGIIELLYLIFHVDFRYYMVNAGVLQFRHVVSWLMYIPFFFIFYISNSIRVNLGIAFEGFSETKSYIIASVSNSIGLIAILLLQYGKYAITGECYWNSFLYINIVFGIAALMAALPILNRLFFKITNKPYLGAMITTMIFIMMSMCGTINLIPIA